jgi:hypothetical protein
MKGLKDIELIANKAKIPTSSNLYSHQVNNSSILYAISTTIWIVAIIALIFLIKKNIFITIICFNVILILIGIRNFPEHLQKVCFQANTKNNNQLYKKNITLKKELFQNLVINSQMLVALISNQQSNIENDSFNEFLSFNKDVNSFLNRIEELFPGKVYYPIKFDIENLLSNPIVIIEYNSLIAIFIDIPYTIEHRNDDYLRVKHLSNSQDEYLLNNLGLISISFSEEQIVKNMLGCSEYICRLIVRITGDINLLDTINSQVPNLVKIQQWDISDAVHLENHKYREEYLV